MKLCFREFLRGYAAPAAEHAAGFEQGRRSGQRLAFHALATIDDLDAFANDPEHPASLEGTVDYAPLGQGLPMRGARLHLFVPVPGGRRLAYRIPFEASGTRYLLLGEKRITGRPGFRSMTTLYVDVYAGWEEPGPAAREPVARGCVRVPVLEALRFPFSFHVPDRSRLGSLAPALRFLRLAHRELALRQGPA